MCPFPTHEYKCTHHKPRTRDHIYFTVLKSNISITTVSVIFISDPIFGGGDAIQPSPCGQICQTCMRKPCNVPHIARSFLLSIEDVQSRAVHSHSGRHSLKSYELVTCQRAKNRVWTSLTHFYVTV